MESLGSQMAIPKTSPRTEKQYHTDGFQVNTMNRETRTGQRIQRIVWMKRYGMNTLQLKCRFKSRSQHQTFVTRTRRGIAGFVLLKKGHGTDVLARLAHLVNDLCWGRTLGTMPAPTMGGYPIVPETASMVFWTQSGHHVTVFTTNNTGAVRIDGIALSDLDESALREALEMGSSETIR